MKDSAEPTVTEIDDLVALVMDLTPFVDTEGQAFLYPLHKKAGKRLVLKFDDRRVRSLLFSLAADRHEQLPTWGQVGKALALVQGRLLKDWKGPSAEEGDPTLRLFLTAVGEHEGWAGSAKEFLTLLRETQKARKVVKDTSALPANPTAMGVWLADNQHCLREYGIELYRPTRRSAKRLWAWRRVMEIHDANDTCPTPSSARAALLSTKDDSTLQSGATRDAFDENVIASLEAVLKDSLTSKEQP